MRAFWGNTFFQLLFNCITLANCNWGCFQICCDVVTRFPVRIQMEHRHNGRGQSRAGFAKMFENEQKKTARADFFCKPSHVWCDTIIITIIVSINGSDTSVARVSNCRFLCKQMIRYLCLLKIKVYWWIFLSTPWRYSSRRAGYAHAHKHMAIHTLAMNTAILRLVVCKNQHRLMYSSRTWASCACTWEQLTNHEPASRCCLLFVVAFTFTFVPAVLPTAARSAAEYLFKEKYRTLYVWTTWHRTCSKSSYVNIRLNRPRYVRTGSSVYLIHVKRKTCAGIRCQV